MSTTAPAFRDDALEFALLGGVVSDPRTLPQVAAIVSAQDFGLSVHGLVWECLVRLDAERTGVTLALLEAELRRLKRYNAVAQSCELVSLPFMRVAWETLEGYAKRVADYARARRVLGELDRARSATSASPDVFADHVLAKVSAAAKGRATLDAPDMGEAAMEFDAFLAERLANRGTRGVTTGINALDEKTGGLKAGHLIIVAGRPAMGKTSLATGMARASAVQGHSTLVFSLEMTRSELMMRLCCSATGVNSQAVEAGAIDGEQTAALHHAANDLSHLPMRIFDRTPMRVEDIRAACLRHAAERPVGLVVVDYLGLLHIPIRNGQDREDMLLGQATRQFKELAKELGCAVVLLAQLNRKCEERANKRPVPSDLRSSGEIEAHADMILFVYREHVYDPDADVEGAEIIIAKQRGGSIGIVDVRFNAERTTFYDVPDADNVRSLEAARKKRTAHARQAAGAETFSFSGDESEGSNDGDE